MRPNATPTNPPTCQALGDRVTAPAASMTTANSNSTFRPVTAITADVANLSVCVKQRQDHQLQFNGGCGGAEVDPKKKENWP